MGCSDEPLSTSRGAKSHGIRIRGQVVEYEKTEEGWRQSVTHIRDSKGNGQITIEVKQDPNTPPRLFARDTSSHSDVMLFDPNPRFRNLQFGRVEPVAFKAVDGHQVKGGLYYPILIISQENRYPLVIQTHGWNPQIFSIDGPYSTSFIAQPLAGKQIFVLQLEEELPHMYAANEAELEMSGYEGGINYLDQIGKIDPEVCRHHRFQSNRLPR